MKFKVLIAVAVLFISCSNDKKQTEQTKQAVAFKSDILLERSAKRPLSKPNNEKEECTLTISGKTVLEGTATIKVIDAEGEEVSCKTFPAKELIHEEYKTANSALQEAHIREVVESYFDEGKDLAFLE